MQAINNAHTSIKIGTGQENNGGITAAVKDQQVAAAPRRLALNDNTNNRRPTAAAPAPQQHAPAPQALLRSRVTTTQAAAAPQNRLRRARAGTSTSAIARTATIQAVLRQTNAEALMLQDAVMEDEPEEEVCAPAPAVVAAEPAPESYSERMMRMGVPDIDAADASDPQAATEYVVEILDYMRSIEGSYMPMPNYMARHPELAWHSRSLLCNWMVEVHWRYKFFPETLFLAVNLLDRYLSLATSPVSRNRLQLVGVAALVVAAKFEEIRVPAMEEFSQVTQSNFSETDIIKMERQLLYVLQFNLNFPSPLTFLRRISKAEEYDVPTRTVAKYLMEITVLHENFLQYPPSLLAAASTFLARQVLRKGEWDNTMQFYSNFTAEQLQPCVSHMTQFLTANSPDFRSVYKKYSSSKFLRASLYVEQELRRQANGN